MHGRHGEAASCRNPAVLRSSRWRARLELEPTSGKIKGFKGRCARDRPEIAKSRAPVMRSSQHEVLAAEITTAAGLRTPCFASEAGLPLLAPRWQILPGCCCTRQPSSFCLASLNNSMISVIHMRWMWSCAPNLETQKSSETQKHADSEVKTRAAAFAVVGHGIFCLGAFQAAFFYNAVIGWQAGGLCQTCLRQIGHRRHL